MEPSFKERCISLRRKGSSIIEIMRVTGRPKTSIYTHIKDIPLSEARWKEIKKAAAAHIAKYPAARKGKSLRSFRNFIDWTPERVLLVAHLSFDGGLRQNVCEYNNRSEALIRRVETLMRDLYDFDPNRTRNKQTGVYRISYFNVALSAFLKEKSREMFSTIKNMNQTHKREFLRAFFDDEGCMDFRPARNLRRVRGYQKDTSILETVQKLLSDFEINAHIEAPNEVVIFGRDSLKKFQKEINFSSGVRINGKRSNSIWGESLEKRLLLDRAIKSFKNQ